MYDKDSQFLCHLQTPFGQDGFKTSVKMPKRTNSVLIWSKKKSLRPWVIDIGSGGKILDLLDLEKQVAVVGTASFTIGQQKNLS